MSNPQMSNSIDAEDDIVEFYTEYPDDRMSISYEPDTKFFAVKVECSKVGYGRSLFDAIYDAKKNFSIKKVVTLAKSEQLHDELSNAIKRAAQYCSDREFSDLVNEVREIQRVILQKKVCS